MLDFAEDPETDVPGSLHSGVPLGIDSTIGTKCLFLGSTVPVRPWKHPDCVEWSVARWDPTATTSHSRKRWNMSSPKMSVYSARTASTGGLRGNPSDFDGLVLWRQNWLASLDQKKMAQSKSASSSTFAAQQVILPRVKDIAISVVDLLVASDKSNPSGIDLGWIDFTDAFHTLAVREHKEGHLAFQIDFKLSTEWAGDEDWTCKRVKRQTLADKKRFHHLCAEECEPFDDAQDKNWEEKERQI